MCSRLGCLSDPRCLGLDYVIAELNMAAPCSCFSFAFLCNTDDACIKYTTVLEEDLHMECINCNITFDLAFPLTWT